MTLEEFSSILADARERLRKMQSINGVRPLTATVAIDMLMVIVKEHIASQSKIPDPTPSQLGKASLDEFPSKRPR